MKPAMTYRGGCIVPGSRRRPAGTGIALGAVALTAAGCSQALPLGPAPAAQHHLATAIVLQIVVSQQEGPAGSCPDGSARLPRAAEAFPGSGQCYRKTGTPVTITSGAVSYVQQPAVNQQPANYGLMITVPAADRAALLAITTKAYHSRHPLATIVAGRTWGVPNVAGPFTGWFEISAQSAKQALHLQRTLVPSA